MSSSNQMVAAKHGRVWKKKLKIRLVGPAVLKVTV